MNHSPLLLLFYGIPILVTGIAILINPAKAWRKKHKAWKARRNLLEAGADELYFEERRTLETYPPLSSPLKTGLFGAMMVVFGLYLIADAFLR